MRILSYLLFLFLLSIFSINSSFAKNENKVNIIVESKEPRILFGAEKLIAALKGVGIEASLASNNKISAKQKNIVVATQATLSSAIKKQIQIEKYPTAKESFAIASFGKNNSLLLGADASGALYACLELADKIKETKKIPASFQLYDAPEMVLRGTAIGIQKPEYLPGRDVYEYPYTPESFPWFYDKQHWIDYLDMLVENRYNSLYLWNGHPFSSLVKLKDYPYALEVDEATFRKNEEVFKFLTEEADKRGIWVIQMFYNILIPKPFAEKHGLKTQDRNRPIIPLIADYTQKSIAAFVEKYPNVGLLITLGEAMEGVGQDDIDWFTKTIIPGVKDGLKALGTQTEPPIVLRAHDTDAPAVMKAALPLYKNLYTMAKFNGEALTVPEPRGKWADLHRTLSRIGTVHIENVHILANLEPFRYSSPDFIQRSVKGMHHVLEANGLHLYPQASYWDWPYTADKAPKRLMQIDRDWMWYKAWARYAWKADRNSTEDFNFWSQELSEKFGTNADANKYFVEAYNQAGEISPKILRRFGITDGNRQTSTLGMLMTQFINPFRYGLFTLMYESEAPEGEMIIDYAEKEWKGEKHVGETPMQIAEEIVAHGKKAVAAIEKVAPYVTKNQEEFNRIKNDMYIHLAMAQHYSDKVKAAIQVLRFKYSNDVTDLEKALPLLKSSVAYYKNLTSLTENTYLYANSMQTKQRKIPMRGVDKTFIHWKEVLPVFKVELANFKHSIDSLKNTKNTKAPTVKAYDNANVKLLGNYQTYIVQQNAKPFSDKDEKIEALAPELKGLKGIALNTSEQQKNGTKLEFSNTKPVTVLVGFFTEKSTEYSPAPVLEIDASANDYGQAESKISKAVILKGMPNVNIHAYTFPTGKNTLTLAKGKALVLGFVDGNQNIKIYDAALDGSGKDIDWLFGEYKPTDVKL